MQYQQRKTCSVPYDSPLLAPTRGPALTLVSGMKCPDIENSDEGTIRIGAATFDGPDADVCDRS